MIYRIVTQVFKLLLAAVFEGFV